MSLPRRGIYLILPSLIVLTAASRPGPAAEDGPDLKRAELEWGDLAGRIDPQATLWTWAWGRFPELVHEQLPGVNETHEVRVILRNGDEHVGFPDNRLSTAGRLVLATSAGDAGPWPIDQVASVKRIQKQ